MASRATFIPELQAVLLSDNTEVKVPVSAV